jgi:adenylosuccinate synthase
MKAVLTAGLGFGDEGKGSTIDYLARKLHREQRVSCVVRYNGGAQAAHNVVLPGGHQHTFAQFGSGFFAGVPTHLSRFMLVNPLSLWNEAEALKGYTSDPYVDLTIDREALVTNPFQVCVNRLKEIIRGGGRHGSCGMGIGETVADSLAAPEMAIRVGDIQDPETLLRKMRFSQELKLAQVELFLGGQSLTYKDPGYEYLATLREVGAAEVFAGRFMEHAKTWKLVDHTFLPMMLKQGTVLFEGAQGVLLDQNYGFHPHTTWSDTTFENAFKLLAGLDCEIERLGIIRGYMTRHGAGPMPTETDCIPGDAHNQFGQFQQDFRRGWFDRVLIKYALEVIGGVDSLVVTNLDKLPQQGIQYLTNYEMPSGTKIGQDGTSLPYRHIWGQPTPDDLKWQQDLGALLGTCKKHYETLGSRNELLKKIEEDLNVKVGLCSYGPTWEQKTTKLKYLEANSWNF